MLPSVTVLWIDYQREKSVHKVAALYGSTGETVRAHLRKGGYDTSRLTAWTAQELDILRDWYGAHDTCKEFSLEVLAERLGRLKSNVSRKARELGLTNQTRKKTATRKGPRPNKYASKEELKKATSDRVKKHIQENGHPRGALGMKHTDKVKTESRARSRRMWADPLSKVNSQDNRQRLSDLLVERHKSGDGIGPRSSSPYSRTKSGTRTDLGFFVRSSWEANYARFLIFLKARGEIKDWEYEKHTFWFEKIKRGVRSYTPDFKVYLSQGGHEWHEVKGWMDAKSVTRLKRMAKYYPEEKMVIIDEAWFKQANRTLDGLIPNWEKRERKTL
jgi:hypothetical protein